MAITPTLAGDTIYQGAAHIIFDKTGEAAAWKYIWCDGDVTIRLVRPERDVNVAGFGRVAGPINDETVEVTFTPSSQINADILAFLWGDILSKMPGASWFGATDTVVYVHTMAGRVMAFSNMRPTTFVPINFGLGVPRFGGAVTLTGVVKRATARTADNALFTPWATLAFSRAPGEDDFPSYPCAVSWASIADTTIEGMEAWTLTPQVQLVPVTLPNLGTIDYRVQSVSLEASATPANLLETNLWAAAAIGSSRALGTQNAGGTLTLAEDVGGLTATVLNAVWVNAPTVFNPEKPIAGQCVWRSRRKSTTGTWGAAGTCVMTPVS
ncbi:MAG TPA: hypothetical protein PLN93_10995 [Vicinamibacterales bacterium]|nr:hypothetical protein [Vicinamibacterales bacterium]